MTSFLNKIIRVRVSKEVLKKAKELQKKFPDDYENLSATFRAGLMRLWKDKQLEAKP